MFATIEVVGDGVALFDTRFFETVGFFPLSVVQIVIELGGMRYAAKPGEQSLLATVAVPHGHQGAEVFDRREVTENGRYLFVTGVADAHRFGNVFVDGFDHRWGGMLWVRCFPDGCRPIFP